MDEVQQQAIARQIMQLSADMQRLYNNALALKVYVDAWGGLSGLTNEALQAAEDLSHMEIDLTADPQINEPSSAYTTIQAFLALFDNGPVSGSTGHRTNIARVIVGPRN